VRGKCERGIVCLSRLKARQPSLARARDRHALCARRPIRCSLDIGLLNQRFHFYTTITKQKCHREGGGSFKGGIVSDSRCLRESDILRRVRLRTAIALIARRRPT